MTADEEHEHAGTPAGRRLVLDSLLPFIERAAHRYSQPGKVCEPGDLVSIGYMAAARKIEHWQPRPGVPCWAYLKPFVRSAMSKAVREANTPTDYDPEFLPCQLNEGPTEHERKLAKLPEAQRRVVEMRLIQTPRATEREAAKVLGVNVREIRRLLWQALETLKSA
jgi:RNA polymerase sigma factor (sigma-70 family)